MPPEWALGHHHSRSGYRGEADLRRVAAGFREHGLSLSALHLDIDHMRGHRVLTVDRQAFPDLRGFSEGLANDGIRLVSIVDPGVKVDPDFDLFDDGRKRNAFCRLPDGNLSTAPVWPGWAAFPDFTDERVRRWWGEQYSRLLDQGISGVWHDMNEPACFAAWGDRTLPLRTLHALDGRRGDHAQAHNLYALEMARAGHEGLRRLRPGSRPFILTRSGWAGVQRYAWTWTGDTRSNWETLRQTIPTVLGLGLSGIPYSGPDIGGFTGHPDAELFIRWFQLATFMPFFRNHSALKTPRREPWLYGEPTLSIVREHIRLRRRLMPYFYTLALEASLTGQPIVRPLFWDDRESERLWSIEDAFMLGVCLLVAPVLEPDTRHRSLELPKGRWFGLEDGPWMDGPCEVTLETDLESIPVFVRGGSILPMMEDGLLTIHVYPDREDSARGNVYLDAGDGYGDSLELAFRMLREQDGIVLSVSSKGSFTPAFSSVQVTLHSMDVSAAWLDDTLISFDHVHATLPIFGAHSLRLE